MNVAIPIALSAFPDELDPASLVWAGKADPKVIHHNRLSKCGHFAAWEQTEF